MCIGLGKNKCCIKMQTSNITLEDFREIRKKGQQLYPSYLNNGLKINGGQI